MHKHTYTHTHTAFHLFNRNFGCTKVRSQVCTRLTNLIKKNPEQPHSLTPQGIFAELKVARVTDPITSSSTSNRRGFSEDCQPVQLEVIKSFRDKMD